MVNSNRAVNPVREDGVIDGTIIGTVAGGATAAGLYYGGGAAAKKQSARNQNLRTAKGELDRRMDDAVYKRHEDKINNIQTSIDKHNRYNKPLQGAKNLAFSKGGFGEGTFKAGGKGRAIAGAVGVATGAGLIGMGMDALNN